MHRVHKQLCHYDEIPDPGSKGLLVEAHDTRISIFIVKKNEKVYAYENSCPHTLGPLDWTPDCFLDEQGEYIICANHGALFQIPDGLCIYGPCKNQRLQALPCIIRDRAVHVLI